MESKEVLHAVWNGEPGQVGSVAVRLCCQWGSVSNSPCR